MRRSIFFFRRVSTVRRSQLGRHPAYPAGSRSIARHDAARPSPAVRRRSRPFRVTIAAAQRRRADDQFALWKLVSLLTALKPRYGRVADLERSRDRRHMLTGLLALASFTALIRVKLWPAP